MMLGSLVWIAVVFAAIALMLPPVGLSVLVVWLVGTLLLAPVWVPLAWLVFSRREARVRREAAEQDAARLALEELLGPRPPTGGSTKAEETMLPSQRRLRG